MKADYIIEGFIEVASDYMIVENRLIDAARDSVISISKKKTDQLPKNIAAFGVEVAKALYRKMEFPDHYLLPGVKQGERDRNIQVSITKEDPGQPWRLYAKHLLRDYDVNNLKIAMQAYNKAIELNPMDADALAGIAATYSFQGASGIFGVDISDIHRQADTAVTKALSINPNQPTALMIRAEILVERDWDYETAECYIKRALNLLPNNPDTLTLHSSLLISMGRFNESLIMAERACELDPVNSWTFSAKYWSLIALKSYRKANLVVEEIDKIFPHAIQNRFSKAFTQLLLGNNEKFITAVEEMQSALASEGMQTLLGLLA